MKNILITIVCTAFLWFTSSAMATTIYYEATNVSGVGTITYGMGANAMDAPEFTFVGSAGNVDENLSLFSPGEYALSFSLVGFWADFNEDGNVDFQFSDIGLSNNISFTTGPYTIPALPPLSGTYGQLSWDFNPYSSLSLSYDFGTMGFTNADANSMLAFLDMQSSQGWPDGIMNADLGWESLRVELNSTASVPEPSTLLLMGVGLFGLVGYNRKRFSKKR